MNERLREAAGHGDDITRIDGRVLEIAVAEARLVDGVSAQLLAAAQRRLGEWQCYQADRKKRADEMRARRAEVSERQDAENEDFAQRVQERKELKASGEKLFDAVGDEDAGAVRRLLEMGLPVELEDHEGNTPLSEAACYGAAEVVELLIRKRANLDTRNTQGRTPLWRAGYNGHLQVVELLLESGADKMIETHEGEPPWKFGTKETKAAIERWDAAKTAAKRKDFTASQLLPLPWPRQLLQACEEGNVDAASAVLDVVPEASTCVLDMDSGCDALWMASAFGHADLCRALLDAGSDVDSCSGVGLTPLMIACRKGHAVVVEELLRRGARTHLRSEHGRLATDYAREQLGHGGERLHARLMEHVRAVEDWTTLDEESRQAGGNKVASADALEELLGPGNARAAAAATAQLRDMSAEELRAGGQHYQELLEQRALADVLGIG